MQRIVRNPAPPRQDAQFAQEHPSPALMLARRIRTEQGTERARQFLIAMEPFLAPAERNHIADMIGIALPVQNPSQRMPENNTQQANPQPQMQNNSGMNNPAQLMQMLNMMNGMKQPGAAKSSKSGMDPMMMAQLFNMMK